MAILAYGGLAELAVAQESETFAVPDGMPSKSAGAFPIAYISSTSRSGGKGASRPARPSSCSSGRRCRAHRGGDRQGNGRARHRRREHPEKPRAREHGADDFSSTTRRRSSRTASMALTDASADVCFDP